MDTVKRKRALTLAELLIAMTLSVILILAISYQFVAMVRFSNALKNKAEPSREAYIVLAQMADVLRFAKPSAVGGITFTSNGDDKLSATIEGYPDFPNTAGHIPLIPNTALCSYRRDAGENNLYFKRGTDNEVLLGGTVEDDYSHPRPEHVHVTYFNAIWDPTNYVITIKLIFTQGGFDIPVETTIKVLVQ